MKLTTEEKQKLALAVKSLLEYYKSSGLAKMFNVTRQTISNWSKGLHGTKQALRSCEAKLKEIEQ
jgi:transposase